MDSTAAPDHMVAPAAAPRGSAPPEYDAVVVGASLAGCTTAILLGRAGARVALVERQPDPSAYKRVCSHFIQASAVPTLERLGLLDPIVAVGGLRCSFHMWTRWGWIDLPADGHRGVNVRRLVLDPMIRDAAAATPGVELLLGRSVEALLWDGETVAGVRLRDRDGTETRLRARLTVGADGRDSRVGRLSGLPLRTSPHGRAAFGGYFEGGAPRQAPDAALWMLDPQFLAGFPTDSGLTFYAAMVTRERVAEFKRDPERELRKLAADIPDPPPLEEGRLVGRMQGKLKMPNRSRDPVGPGVALAGDAALAIDPLFGAGCGWALESGAWLADSVGPALAGFKPLRRGLQRYRRRHRLELGGPAAMMRSYATGRRMQAGERLIFSGAARDPRIAAGFDALTARQIGPAGVLTRIVPRAIAVNTRHALAA